MLLKLKKQGEGHGVFERAFFYMRGLQPMYGDMLCDMEKSYNMYQFCEKKSYVHIFICDLRSIHNCNNNEQ